MRVLMLVSEKKQKHIDTAGLVTLAERDGIFIDVVSGELLPRFKDNHYDVIIQKLTDYAAQSFLGDESSANVIGFFQKFVLSQPETCVIIDPLCYSEILLDRSKTAEKLKRCTRQIKGWNIFVPTTVTLHSSAELDSFHERLEEYRMNLPVLCKPVLAHGAESAHQMDIICTPSGIPSISPPIIIQEFIEHDAFLIKIFVIGQFFFTCLRPSIRNNIQDLSVDGSIHFDSHSISKPNSSSPLNEVGAHLRSGSILSNTIVKTMVDAVRQEFSLQLFGIDAIVRSGTKDVFMVDINHFPGYSGMRDFHRHMIDMIASNTRKKEVSKI
eukprot:gene7977-10049_t